MPCATLHCRFIVMVEIDRPAAVETVVKLGGGVLTHSERFNQVLEAIAAAAQERRLLVVTGGGPFADVVRDMDRRVHLSDDAAHWMAVLAMDQYAHLVASRLRRGVIVAHVPEIVEALGTASVPVLAPSRWLREADPLPHSWAVTSDSIAAWVAGAVGARRLVLVKPPGLQLSEQTGATGCGAASPRAVERELVDAYFTFALPAHVTPVTVAADRVDALHSALRGGA